MRSILADLFYKNAEANPKKEAIWCDGKSMTYAQMAELVSKYSNFLLSAGVVTGDHVAISMNNSIESVALFFAAADLGVCVVPLNPTLPLEAIKTAMQFGDMKHLIARKAFFTEMEKSGGVEVPGASICLDGEFPGTIPFAQLDTMSADRPTCENLTGDESLILTMTSGSTGTPKPIDISQRNKYDRFMAHVRVYGITSEDRVLAATPLYHSLAERLVLMPLMLGGTSVLLPRFTPALWLKCVEEQKPTFTIAVSAQLAQILTALQQPEAPDIKSFRCIVSSSALLEYPVKLALIEKLQCQFHEMYGASEISTATDICFGKAEGKEKSVGLPFDGAKVRILNDNDEDCAPNEVGEIAVCSPLTCKGYYKQEAMMQAVTVDGYFKTGDLGYLDEDGYLYFAGRKKELIITGAVNVYPNDIDAVVSKMPEVAECAAFAYPDERLGEVVALAVVPQPGIEIKIRTVKLYCARNLADFQQPHKIFVVDKLLKNAMNKLQRNGMLEYIQELGLDQ